MLEYSLANVGSVRIEAGLVVASALFAGSDSACRGLVVATVLFAGNEFLPTALSPNGLSYCTRPMISDTRG